MKKFLLVPAALLLWTGVAIAQEAPAAPDPMVKCRACHGKNFEGKGKLGPIAGMSLADLKASLTTKIPKGMASYSKNLTPAQIDSMCATIAALPKVAPAPAPAP